MQGSTVFQVLEGADTKVLKGPSALVPWLAAGIQLTFTSDRAAL